MSAPASGPGPSPAPPSGFAAVRGPLLLLALGGLVLFEPVLPARDAIVRNLGENAVLRFAVLGLCLFTALLLFERHRTTRLLRGLLGDLQRMAGRGGMAGQGTREVGGESGPRDEAVAILIEALGSADAEVRERAHAHLCRLTGMDLGRDPAAWRNGRARGD